MPNDTQNYLWRGELVRLRAIEPDDWKVFYAINQETTTIARQIDEIPFPISAAAVEKWAKDQSTTEVKNDEKFMVIESLLDAEGVGGISSYSADRLVGNFMFDVFILPEYQHKGYAREAILLLIRYFFNELRYQKCTSVVFSFNDASQALHQSLGFQLEGRLRRLGFTGGQYYDYLYYGLTVEEFREKHPMYGVEQLGVEPF